MSNATNLQAWPPPERAELLNNVIALGVLLGVIEGVAIGAISGIQYGNPEFGCSMGMFFGMFYGGMTGWVFSYARHSSRLVLGLRILPGMCWLIGALIIGWSVAFLAAIGETHEFVSAPLPFAATAFLGAFCAVAVELIVAENRCRRSELANGASTGIIPATAMTHVCQGDGNCAIASIATVAGATYKEVLARRAKPETKRGPGQKETLALLEIATGVQWKLVLLNIVPRRLDDIAFPDWPVLVIIRPGWHAFTLHCIVVNGRVVHDPSWPFPCYMGDYGNKSWKALFAYEPDNMPSGTRG